jgi:hypothetical protein
MISEVTYHLIAYILVIQFKNTLIQHFSPHQFGVTIHVEYQTMVHGI